MHKSFKTLLIASVFFCVLLGLLVGCKNTAPEEPGITEIQTFQQTSGQIEMTNYQVVFNQTAEEWNALPIEEKEALVQEGYDQSREQIQSKEVSNYNILGKTAPSEDADGNVTDSELAFLLDHERAALLVYEGVDESGKPIVASEISLEAPSAE
jgi:hypothetical protein